MAVSEDDFKNAFPEFRNADAAEVEEALASAELQTGSNWGDHRNRAVMLLTAHLLRLSPLAEPMAPVPTSGSKAKSRNMQQPTGRPMTRYLAERLAIRDQIFVPVFMSGQ